VNLMLKRGVGVLAGTALLVAILAVLPAVAEAQEGTASTHDVRSAMRSADTAPARTVVRPGDSLWSISGERLGPDATPQRIANEVERIYALNRHRIGDPNLIFAGQKLLLPPVEPSAAGTSSGATPAREATEPVESSPTDRAAKSETERASGTTDGKTKPAQVPTRDPDPERASKTPRDTEAKPVVLPDLPTKEVTPEASSLATKEAFPSPVVSSAVSAVSAIVDWAAAGARSLSEVRYSERQLLGLGFFAIAFGAILGFVVLLARMLRERRHAERRMRQRVYGRIDPFAGLDNRLKPATVVPEPVRSAEDRSPKSAGDKTADAPSTGAWPKATDAKDPTLEIQQGREA
jgi:hypothetical protein